MVSSSPELQYKTELEIAGLSDRPSAKIPVSEKLERLRFRQDMNRESDRDLLQIPIEDVPGSLHYYGDLIIHWTGHQSLKAPTIDVGQVCNTLPGNKASIIWWSITAPCPFVQFSVNLAEGVLVLLENRVGSEFELDNGRSM